jgi:hypothetical protein
MQVVFRIRTGTWRVDPGDGLNGGDWHVRATACGLTGIDKRTVSGHRAFEPWVLRRYPAMSADPAISSAAAALIEAAGRGSQTALRRL